MRRVCDRSTFLALFATTRRTIVFVGVVLALTLASLLLRETAPWWVLLIGALVAFAVAIFVGSRLAEKDLIERAQEHDRRQA